MPGEGLANGIAPLDSSSRVPPQNSQNVEDLETGLSIGEAVVGDGVGGLVELEVPGSYYSQVESNATDTTTGGPATYITLDTDSEDGDVPAGRYRIAWHYVWQTDGTNNTVEVVLDMVAPGAGPNVLLNNPGGVSSSGKYEPQDADNEHEVSGWRNITLNAGRQVFVMTFQQTDGAGTVSIHRGAIEIMRVPNP